MLKIWLKLVLKGRCARKSRPVLEGLFGSRRERCPMIGASSRLFKKNSLFFLFFAARTWVLRASGLWLAPADSIRRQSGTLSHVHVVPGQVRRYLALRTLTHTHIRCASRLWQRGVGPEVEKRGSEVPGQVGHGSVVFCDPHYACRKRRRSRLIGQGG